MWQYIYKSMLMYNLYETSCIVICISFTSTVIKECFPNTDFTAFRFVMILEVYLLIVMKLCKSDKLFLDIDTE